MQSVQVGLTVCTHAEKRTEITCRFTIYAHHQGHMTLINGHVTIYHEGHVMIYLKIMVTIYQHGHVTMCLALRSYDHVTKVM